MVGGVSFLAEGFQVSGEVFAVSLFCLMPAAVYGAHTGKAIQFWHDIWIGDGPLKQKYPSLF